MRAFFGRSGGLSAHLARRSWVEQLEERRLLSVVTFTNTAFIQQLRTAAAPPQPASPYPSEITVTGFVGNINDVTVTLRQVSFTSNEAAGAIDLMLVSPTGQSLLLMSDATNNMGLTQDYTFSDAAAGQLPQTGPVTAGTFRPTDYDPAGDADNFASPAPAPSAAAALSVFDGTNPNGVWQLYVVRDDANVFNTFELNGGWSLTVDADAAPKLIISEYRTQGPNNTANNEFVELYNPSDSPVTVSTTDGSSGWALAPSDGIARFVVPNGTVIPPRGHFLGANNSSTGGYSLGSYATPDATWTTNITSGLFGEPAGRRGIALFRTSNASNFNLNFRLDAAGPSGATGEANSLYREGAGHSVFFSTAFSPEFSYVRLQYPGGPLDTDNNNPDWISLSQDSNAGLAAPENLASPVTINANLPASLLDPAVADGAAPNRQRDFAPVTYPGRTEPARFGTMTIRRIFTNNTGAPITNLRFRIASLRNVPTDNATAQSATLRMVNSTDTNVSVTGGGNVLVRGTTLEEPPNQPAWGGVNNAMAVTAITGANPLLPGQSVAVQFVVAVTATGEVRFRLNAEATLGAGGSIGAGTGGPALTEAAIPPPRPDNPTIDAASDTGVSNSDRITQDLTPTMRGTGAAPNAPVHIYASYTNDAGSGAFIIAGTTTADSSGDYVLDLGPLPEGDYFFSPVSTVDNVSSLSALLTGRIDATPPSVVSTPTFFGTSPQRLVYNFNENIHQFLSTDDLVLTNLDNGQTIPSSSLSVTFPGGNKQATITFPGLPNGRLPAGNFRMTILRAGMIDLAGNQLTADHIHNFTTIPPLIISELRTRGPNGPLDEYIELYNPSTPNYLVQATDGSSGWSVVMSPGTVLFTIPNNTIITRRGSYLGANNSAGGYSLTGVASPDKTWTANIPDAGSGEGGVRRGIAIFSTTNPVNFTTAFRLDAAGPAGETNTLFREGTGFANVTLGTEHAIIRDLSGGAERDTDDNAADFIVVDASANPTTTAVRHGAPWPRQQITNDPFPLNGMIGISLLDTAAGANASPNTVRDITPGADATSSFGTLTIRRRFTNNTGQPLDQLRFRVVDLSATGADLRPITSSDQTVSTSGGNVLVRGTTLQTPPNQPLGGGINSSFRVPTITNLNQLAPGASIDVQFVFGVERPGDIRIALSADVRYNNPSGIVPNQTAGPAQYNIDALAAPPQPELDSASDTGASNADAITNDTTPTLTGTVNPGSTVQVFENDTFLGVTTANGSGLWSFTTGVLPPGDHPFRTLVSIGSAQSNFSPSLIVTIDNAPPATPAAPDLSPASDTGVSPTDNLTNDDTPDFTGTVEPNATVFLFVDGIPRGSAVASGAGLYTVTSGALADGTRQVTVNVRDIAGNTSANSAALPIVIDTAPPAFGGPPVFVVTPPHQLTYNFTENVSQSFTTADLTLLNLTTGQPVPSASMLVTFNGPGTHPTVTFPGFPGGALPPAEYRATLAVAGVTDAAGNAVPPPDSVFDFNTLPPLIISELRTRGPAGARDEYVELYNPSASQVTVSAVGSSVWAVAASDGIIRFIVPNGTVIPARGHYLGVNNGAGGYSLGAYAAADAAYTLNIPDNGAGEGGVTRGVTLFRTADPTQLNFANRLDAVGPAGETNTLYREGLGYANVSTAAPAEYALFRNAVTGRPQDTDDNAADIRLVDPTGNPALATGNRWGAPGPENLAGPVQINGQLGVALVDPGAAASAAPNRQRDLGNGTLTIRRRFTNNSGRPITLLRFRVADLTNDLASSTASVLRAVTSSDATVPTTGGNLLVRGTSLEQPPTQADGGGLNSSMRVSAVSAGTPLAAGASIDLQFVFNVVENGDLNVVLNAEASFTAPAAPGPGTAAPFSDTAIAPIAAAPDLDAASDTGASNTDDLTGDNTPTLAGVTSPSATVQLFEGTTLLGTATANGSGNWSINVGTPLGDGAHLLRTAVTANNVTSRFSSTTTVTIDTAAPTADVVDVTPDPRTSAVPSVTITFSQAVTGFNLSDLSLTRDGGANLLTGSQTLSSSDGGITWTLGNLAALTADSGTYALSLTASGSGIADTAGNLLGTNASDSWTLSLPTWLAPSSNATWNVTTKALTVSGSATITGDPGTDMPIVTASGPAAVLTIAPTSDSVINLGGLTLASSATAAVSAAGATRVLVVNGANFSIDAGSKLDLNDNALVLRNAGSGAAGQSSTQQVTGYLKRGLENGGNFDWLGTGISSTEAFNDNTAAGSVLYGVGILQNNLAAAGSPDGTTTDATAGNEIYTTFQGCTVGLNDTLVRYTYMGDADLSGDVTGTDYSLIDNGFAFDLSGWLNGNFDYSGEIDSTDYALIDNAFAFQTGPLVLTATAEPAGEADRERVVDDVVA